MNVVVNGDRVELADGAHVSDAVAVVREEPSTRGIAVAVNGTVIPRSRWPVVRLSESDKIEILTAVAGG